MTTVAVPALKDLDIDPLTMGAIVEMQIQEAEELTNSSKGKQREGTLTDAQLALQMYMADLKRADAALKDRKMAQSIAIAVQRDGDLIHEAYLQEHQAQRDREMALSMSGGGSSTMSRGNGHQNKRQKTQHPDPWADPEMLAKAAVIYMNPPTVDLTGISDDSDDIVEAESSAWAAARKRKRKREHPPRKCIACGDMKPFEEVARVPCGHEYCRTCLATIFRLSMEDEAMFPPRCDRQEIPLDFVRFFLPSDLAKRFEQMYVGLSTANRTYCHDKTCQTFIPTKPGDEMATCPRCHKTTCTTCKSLSHSGDCPEDTALQQLLTTANERQWQRCYRCSRFVELNHGCNHISCPCGAQFCYVCSAKWRTCSCEQWDERRLVERATQIVDRQPHRRLFQPERVAHAQPATRPVTPKAPVVAGPSFEEEEPMIEDYDELQDESLADIAAEAAIPESSNGFLVSAPDEEAEEPEESDVPQASLDPGDEALADIAAFEAFPSSYNGFVVADPITRDSEIAEAIENLRANHDCGHREWRFVKGRHSCEECLNVLKEYIFECRQCRLQACNRCRRNRL